MPKRKVSALLCTTLRCGDALSCKVIASPPLAGLLHARHAVYMEGARHEAGGSRGRGHLLGRLLNIFDGRALQCEEELDYLMVDLALLVARYRRQVNRDHVRNQPQADQPNTEMESIKTRLFGRMKLNRRRDTGISLSGDGTTTSSDSPTSRQPRRSFRPPGSASLVPTCSA